MGTDRKRELKFFRKMRNNIVVLAVVILVILLCTYIL